MLTTKGQKCRMFFIGLCALLLGLVVLVPFKAVFSFNKILIVETIVKVILIPVLMILLSIFPNRLKYEQVKGYRNQSKIVSVLSYFPTFVYLVTIIIESLYLLIQGYILNGGSPIGVTPWNLWFVALIIFFIAIVAFFAFLPRFEMQLDVREHVIFDLVIIVIIVCFAVLFNLLLSSTHEVFLAVGRHGDPFLLCVFVAGLIFFGFELHYISQLIARDEMNLHIKFNDLDAQSYIAKTAEYNRAYNDIMNDFEEYFAETSDEGEYDFEEFDEEECECECEHEHHEELKPEVKEESVKETEEDSEEVLEKMKAVDSLESEVEEMRAAKEQEELLLEAKLKERELAQKEALEKALQNKAEMRPTFAELVAYVKGLEQVNIVENKEKRQIRALIGKKVFLIMTDTDKDYRLQFNVNPNDVVVWWQTNTEIRPRTNKSDNWYKLTNKGTFTKELLQTIISGSRDFMVEEIERIAAEKKAAKEAAKAKAAKAKK